MDVKIFWHRPIALHDGSRDNLIFTCEELSRFDEKTGVYMFCRVYGKNLIPLYIGKALNLSSRISQQLNTTRLMKAVENAQAGLRVLVVGELKCKPGQAADSCIRLAEKALIEQALSSGYELINKSGTRPQYHRLLFQGNAKAKSFSGSKVNLKKNRK